MKFLCERNALHDALVSVTRRSKGRGTMALPILSHVLVEASGQKVTLTGHDLDSCSQATIPAEVEEDGAVAMPGDRFGSLVGGLQSGAQIVISADDQLAKLKSGRSNYQLGVMSAADFPAVLEPQDPLTITLTGDELALLFKTPAPCILNLASHVYLNGIYFYRDGKNLVACATDRHTLIESIVVRDTPKFDGILVPEFACKEFARFCGTGEVRMDITKNLVAIEVGQRRFVSKLIDAEFIKDYRRVIPPTDVAPMLFDRRQFESAVDRLATAIDPSPEVLPVIAFSWDENPSHIAAALNSNFARGDEQIECDCEARDGGTIGAQINYLQKLIDAVGGETIRLYIAGAGIAIRIENPAQPNVIACCWPCKV